MRASFIRAKCAARPLWLQPIHLPCPQPPKRGLEPTEEDLSALEAPLVQVVELVGITACWTTWLSPSVAQYLLAFQARSLI
jgi:hypothetical protein